MFEFIKNLKTKTPKEKLNEWFKGISAKHPTLSKEMELLALYWDVPDFRYQKFLTSKTPKNFTEWSGVIDLQISYETEFGFKKYNLTSTMDLIVDNITPISINYDFHYDYSGLTTTKTIKQVLDIQTLLDAANATQMNKIKAMHTIYFLTAIYALKIARFQFLQERKGKTQLQTN